MGTLGIIVGAIILGYAGNQIESWVRTLADAISELDNRLDVIEKRLGITENNDYDDY